jgi:predicted AlkP superfamily phosphohydrolase/phosphomutase
MSAPSKILIDGLDSATPVLVEKWVAEGRLPTIARFVRDGAFGPLASVPNRHSAAAWSSMVTGLNPGKHGIYWFTEDQPNSYGYRFVNGSFRHGKAFWRILSEQGQRVGIVNVPITYPAEPVNGVFVSGLDTPSTEDPGFTHPPELRHEVVREAGGEYFIHPALARFLIAGDVDGGLDRLHASIDKRTAVAEHLMATREWDVFMVVFTESDVVQHFFWRHMEDPAPEDAPRHRSAIQDTYEHLDRSLARLIERAGGDTLVILVSDHGARADDGLARSLPSWLEHLGMLTYRAEAERGRVNRVVYTSASRIYRELDKRMSPAARHKLARRLPSIRRRVEVMMSYARLDWSKTMAYTDGKRPEIWINLEGRQPQGIVAPEDYEAVRERIIHALTTTVCARTGKPLVSRVMRREEAYHGPFVDRSPDLVVEWMGEGTCLDVRDADGRGFTLVKQHLPDDPFDHLLSGGHDRYGIVGLLGPGVRVGRLEGAEIADIAPTVLFLRGAPVPEDVDGKALTDALAEGLATGPIVREGAAVDATRDDEQRGFSEQEEAEIRDRLEGLGYVE